MKSINAINISFLILLFQASKSSAQKLDSVKISVYYDAAGNASSDFITQQLFKSYPAIASRIILELVPWCLGDMLPGSDSYRANVIHTCAFDQTTDEKIHVDFATCMMNSRVITEENIKKCADNNGLPYDAIIKCAKGAEGRNKLANNGYKTKAIYPPIYQLPAIGNNGWVRAGLQTKAKENFLGYVCAFLNNPPKESTHTTNVKITQ